MRHPRVTRLLSLRLFDILEDVDDVREALVPGRFRGALAVQLVLLPLDLLREVPPGLGGEGFGPGEVPSFAFLAEPVVIPRVALDDVVGHVPLVTRNRFADGLGVELLLHLADVLEVRLLLLPQLLGVQALVLEVELGVGFLLLRSQSKSLSVGPLERLDLDRLDALFLLLLRRLLAELRGERAPQVLLLLLLRRRLRRLASVQILNLRAAVVEEPVRRRRPFGELGELLLPPLLELRLLLGLLRQHRSLRLLFLRSLRGHLRVELRLVRLLPRRDLRLLLGLEP